MHVANSSSPHRLHILSWYNLFIGAIFLVGSKPQMSLMNNNNKIKMKTSPLASVSPLRIKAS